jgi:hypothetical protein
MLLQEATKLTRSDKLFQGTVDVTSQRVYSDIYPDLNLDASFRINRTICPFDGTIPSLYDDHAVPPCSIDNSTSPWTLMNAPSAYRVEATGELNQTADFNQEDFNALESADDSGTFDWTQLVTHIDLVTKDLHVFYFNPIWAREVSEEEDSDTQAHKKHPITDEHAENIGFDYIANTTSIVTRCSPNTMGCGMQTTNDSSKPYMYHCSDILHGDLNAIPENGLEKLRGWNTAFYNFEDGTPRNISIASQLNPFHYNVTAVVDSINIGGLIDFKDPQVGQGTIVGIGDGRVGFALSCTSTIYDVTYSLVEGNVTVFNTTQADPSTAAIIKAPLQAGFGSYALFEKAALSVLFNNLTVVDGMELAFSQTFLALASGVYGTAPALQQRQHYDMTLTKLGKGPFYLLVVGMFLYALVVLVFTVIALIAFRRDDVRELQFRLLRKE